MSLPDFSKFKLRRLSSPGLPMNDPRAKVPIDAQLSGAVPGILDAPTPPLPAAPDAWVAGSTTLPDAPRASSAGSTSGPSTHPASWRATLIEQALPLDDATLVQQVQAATLDELEQPYGLNRTTVLLDLCRHGRVEAIHTALDRGVSATATTVQGLSAVDLLVIPAMNDEVNGANPGPDSTSWLLAPSERQLQAIERLLAGGARFDPDTLPLLAASPLGIRLEQRALRAAMASRPAIASVSTLPSRARTRV